MKLQANSITTIVSLGYLGALEYWDDGWQHELNDTALRAPRHNVYPLFPSPSSFTYFPPNGGLVLRAVPFHSSEAGGGSQPVLLTPGQISFLPPSPNSMMLPDSIQFPFPYSPHPPITDGKTGLSYLTLSFQTAQALFHPLLLLLPSAR